MKALQMVGPRSAIPVHYNDYTLFHSPLDDFRELADATLRDCVVHYLRHGDSHRFELTAGR